MRYWIYGPAGLSAGKVASLTIVAGITFWLGMGFILGVGFLFDADAIGEINHFNALFNQAIGLGHPRRAGRLSRLGRAHARRRRPIIFNFTLPGPLLTLGADDRSASSTSAAPPARSMCCCPRATASAS